MSSTSALVVLLCALASAAPLDKEVLPSSTSAPTCNDGSPYAYYVQTNADSANWVVFQQGGSYCWDELTCTTRKSTNFNLMTSTMLQPQLTINSGILSDIPDNNPSFASWNRVLLPYCTSDAFSGNTSHASWDTKLSFLGSRVIPAVIADLKLRFQLRDDPSTTFIYSGASAGGVGQYPNLDLLSEELLPSSRVVGIIDSGWFLDSAPFVVQNCSATGFTCTTKEVLSRGVPAWQSIVDSDCMAAKAAGDRWQCLQGHYVEPYLSTRLFVFQWQFDLAQLAHDGIHESPSESVEALEYAQERAVDLVQTFASSKKQRHFFSPSCYQHVVLNSKHARTWNTLTVNGVYLVDAITSFVMSEDSAGNITADSCDTPNCNPTCPPPQAAQGQESPELGGASPARD